MTSISCKPNETALFFQRPHTLDAEQDVHKLVPVLFVLLPIESIPSCYRQCGTCFMRFPIVGFSGIVGY